MSVSHRLSLLLRVVDHFTGSPPATVFPVRLSQDYVRPVRRADGAGRRQADGTYRFTNLSPGTSRLLWRDPFTRSHDGWTRWNDDPEVSLPVADPAGALTLEVWPTAAATAPAGATGVRGKLTGPGALGRIVRIALQGQPFDRFTRSDDFGDFLFLPPGALPPNAAGRVPLEIEVRDPDGTMRAVTGGSFLPVSAGAPFAGATFTILPRSVPRILFQLA